MKATIEQVREQANALAMQATALANADNLERWTPDEVSAFVKRLAYNVELLASWTAD